MFFLKLESKDFDRLFEIAQQTGAQIEGLARRAFFEGLRLLAKTDTDTNTTATDHAANEDSPRRTRRDAVTSLHGYIQENWKQKTDGEIAEALGYSMNYIRLTRTGLGFLHQRGHKETPVESSRHQRLDELIRKHRQTKNDAEIGRLMNPPMARMSVQRRRLRLGLHKERGKGRTNFLRQKIDPKEFEHLVIHEGYTMSEYIRLKNLYCSRERLRQIVEEMGLKHSPCERAPEWILIRKARMVDNLNLANREWLAEKVAGADSMAMLAAELAIAEVDLFFFIRSFGLTHPSFRKHGTETETLVCVACGKTFERLKRWTKKRREKAQNGEMLKFFCSTSCNGKYNRERWKERQEKTA